MVANSGDSVLTVGPAASQSVGDRVGGQYSDSPSGGPHSHPSISAYAARFLKIRKRSGFIIKFIAARAGAGRGLRLGLNAQADRAGASGARGRGDRQKRGLAGLCRAPAQGPGLVAANLYMETGRLCTIAGAIDAERRKNWEVQMTAAFPVMVRVFGDSAVFSHCVLYIISGRRG